MSETLQLTNPQQHVICAKITVVEGVTTLDVQTQYEHWLRNYANVIKAQRAFAHNFHKEAVWKTLDKSQPT